MARKSSRKTELKEQAIKDILSIIEKERINVTCIASITSNRDKLFECACSCAKIAYEEKIYFSSSNYFPVRAGIDNLLYWAAKQYFLCANLKEESKNDMWQDEKGF